MKRLAVFTLVLLLILPATAQFNLGIRAGYNSSLSVNNISSVFDGTYNLNSVQNELWNNFQAGIFARVFMKKLYFEPALMYSLEKKELNFKDVATGNVTFDSIADIKTVDIPLIFGLKLLDLKLANLRVFAGPKLRFNAGSTPTITNEDGQFDMQNLTAQVKKANLGLEIGAGVDVLMFALDFRYNLIGNMYETKIENVKFDPASTFVITLGWKLF
jgi:hypothetical protein